MKKKLSRILSQTAPPAAAIGPAAALVEAGPEPPAPEPTLWEKVKPYTFCGEEKLSSLHSLAIKVRDSGVKGDIVECGTYKGGSSAVLGTTLSAGQRLWLYDSFQGMPAVTEKDGTDAAQYVGEGIASEQDVVEIMTKLGVPAENYLIHKGWFEDTFKQPLPEKIALLHCDADWYESVNLVLETFYPLVEEGGCIVMDDFGYWEGCREAFYAFCFKHNIRPLLERRSVDQAYWFKGKTHNRL